MQDKRTINDIRKEHEALLRSVSKDLIGSVAPLLPAAKPPSIPKLISKEVEISKAALESSSQFIAAGFVDQIAKEPEQEQPAPQGEEEESQDTPETPDQPVEEPAQAELEAAPSVMEVPLNQEEPPTDVQLPESQAEPEVSVPEQAPASEEQIQNPFIPVEDEPEYPDGSTGVAVPEGAPNQAAPQEQVAEVAEPDQGEPQAPDAADAIETIPDINPAHVGQDLAIKHDAVFPAINQPQVNDNAAIFRNANQMQFDNGNDAIDGLREFAENTTDVMSRISEVLSQFNIRLKIIESVIEREIQ